jgi:HEAT repeat protein
MAAAGIKKTFVMVAAVVWCPVTAAQVSSEQALRDLTSPDANVRLRAAQRLKEAAPLKAALPLAALVTDPQDDVQLEAIAAEVNIFLADRIVPRKRVGLLIEVRNKIAADAAFSAGPLAIGPRPVPMEVLTALRTAVRDDNPRVGLEALYAFGSLAVEPGGNRRRDLLLSAGSDLAAMVGRADPALRLAAVRVIGRLFTKRPQDQPIDPGVGDAVISALNDNDRVVKSAAMAALGGMRYERAVQALTDLFQYYDRGDLGTAAFDALAQIAHRPSRGPADRPAYRSTGAAQAARPGAAVSRRNRAGPVDRLQSPGAGSRRAAAGRCRRYPWPGRR